MDGWTDNRYGPSLTEQSLNEGEEEPAGRGGVTLELERCEDEPYTSNYNE